MTMGVRTKLWTREEYDRLVAAGAFHPMARLQLVQGEIVEMAPQSAGHATSVRRLQKALERVFGDGYEIRPQLPLALSDDSEPEPDIAVVEGSLEDFRQQHPTRAVLVAEIADSTLRFDKGRKRTMYAAAGVPDYWVLNLADGVLEVYREPRGSAYDTAQRLGPDDRVAPLAAPGRQLLVADLLP
jgi:Uma2 family endonuclease